MSAANVDTLLLTQMQFCHIINNNSGEIRLVEGPFRGSLESHEQLFGMIQNKVILNEGQYAIILNPYNPKTQTIQYGDKEIRIGPRIFSLYPDEKMENNTIYNEYILEEDEGLIITAVRDFKIDEMVRKAGTSWLIQGPTHYIPHKYEDIAKEVKGISLGVNEGVYIKNEKTGAIRLEMGPKSLMLQPEELLFEKIYTRDELIALKLESSERDLTQALSLTLLEREVMLIVSGDKRRVEIGPKIVLLQPMDRIFIINISGSTPKIPNQIKLWKIYTGPVFVSDLLTIRTQDNAELTIQLRYKTQFSLEPDHPEKIFAIQDFIGFATETLGALIRQVAAQYTFEEFHSKARIIIGEEILNGQEHKGIYEFSQNGFQIFDIDIKKIEPKDPVIAQQLNEAIKSNMDVYVKKINQTAELEAEHQLVKGQIEIEHTRRELIELKQENQKAEEIGKALIEAKAMETRAKGEAESIKIVETAKSQIRIEYMKQSLQTLNNEGAEEYLRLQQVQSFNNVEKTIVVPSESKVFMPLGNLEPSLQKKMKSQL